MRWWDPRLGKPEGRGTRKPERWANGQLTWEPDLRRINIAPYLSVPKSGNLAMRVEDGRGPGIHEADLQDKLYIRPAVFTLPVSSPYPIVGGRFHGSLLKDGSSDLDLVSVFFGKPGWRSGDLFQSRRETRTAEIDLDLDPNIRRSRALYEYGIGFAIRGNAASSPPTQAGLDGFRVGL